MIQPTVKATTLPDDLKKHWEDAMAEKFPMTPQEACAYIQNHYMNCSPQLIGNKVRCSVQITHDLPEGAYPPPPPVGSGWIDNGVNMNSRTRRLMAFDYIDIDIEDFKPSAIDEKLKEYKQ